MTLSDNIHQLTNEHLTTADNGAIITAPPLLAQLRAASGSNVGMPGGGSGGAGMIVNSRAVKLETEIREAVLYEHFEMAGTEYRGPLVKLLKSWPLININEWQDYLEHVTLDWIDSIKAMMEAKRPPWHPSIDCPSCGQRFHGGEREPCLSIHYWDHDAEEIAHPSQWMAECIGCGAEWTGDNLKWLRVANDTPSKEVAHMG